MEKNFWLDRWQTNQIGFHLPEAHPLLVKHSQFLSLKEGDRIFLPLCGKTLDIHWFLAQGIDVVGAELAETAIIQLFKELDVEPDITISGKLKLYSAPHIDIFVGDIFDLDKKSIGHVDALYDRAALVALPQEMRERYVQHLKEIAPCFNELLISFEYDPSQYSGPPFYVGHEEIKSYYPKSNLLESRVVEGGLQGIYPAKECAWHISLIPH